MATTPFVPVGDIHPASWHADRALGIGGSECAALFNEGYGCSRQLVMEKRGVPADYKRTAQQEKILRRGNRMEDLVASECSVESGLKIRRQSCRVSPTHPHARVNMDRQIVAVDPHHLYEITRDEHGFSVVADVLDSPGPGALECKTINEFDYRKLLKVGFFNHPHYILQLQHALAVTGYRWGMFAVLEPRSFDMRWFAMVRDEKLIAEILERVERTWDLVMDTSQPLPAQLPEGDKRCNNCLWRRTCRGDGYLEKFAGAEFKADYVDVNDQALLDLANDYIMAAEAEAEASQITEAVKAEIKKHMAATGHKALRVPDVIRFRLSDVSGRRSWDSKAIEGEINALTKGELPTGAEVLADVAPEELQANAGLLALVLKAVADRFAACQKQGAPSTQFRTYAA